MARRGTSSPRLPQRLAPQHQEHDDQEHDVGRSMVEEAIEAPAALMTPEQVKRGQELLFTLRDGLATA